MQVFGNPEIIYIIVVVSRRSQCKKNTNKAILNVIFTIYSSFFLFTGSEALINEKTNYLHILDEIS